MLRQYAFERITDIATGLRSQWQRPGSFRKYVDAI